MKDLKQTHPAYQGQLYRWNYLRNSAVGGVEYRNGGYLHMYEDERYQSTLYSTDEKQGFKLTAAENGNLSYARRLQNVAAANYVRPVIDIYNSMLFKTPAHRNTETLKNPFVADFVRDADLTGEGLESFLKTAFEQALIYGNVWIGVDSPATDAVATQADQIAYGIRPYLTMFAPKNVVDWKYSKQANGSTYLSYIKVIESETTEYIDFVEWDETSITRSRVEVGDVADKDNILQVGTLVSETTTPNPVGCVPYVNIVPIKNLQVPGLGHSPLEDVADICREIYNLESEAEQAIRISSHPSLVAERGTDMMAGAGSTIMVDKGTEVNPYLLQSSASDITAINATIDRKVDRIFRITHLDSIVGLKTQAVSGVALEVSREQLNNRLTDYADTLQEAEMCLWKLFAKFEQFELPEIFVVEYNKQYNIRDSVADVDNAYKAVQAVNDPAFTEWFKVYAVESTIADEDQRAAVVAKLAKVSDQPLDDNGIDDGVADADDSDQEDES